MASKLITVLCLIVLISAPFGDSRATNRRVPRGTVDKISDDLSKAFDALKSFSDAVGKYGYNLQQFAGVISAIGPALGVIGPLFSLATVLIPKGPSAELQALEAGFKQMNVRFDDVDKKLDDILLNIEKTVVYESYKENQDSLQKVFLKYNQFQRVPGAPASQELKEACSRNDPDVALDWIYRNCLQDQVGAQLLDTIFKDVKYDRKTLLQFFQIILRDYTQASFLRQVCLGVRFPNATDVMEDNKKQDEQKMQAVYAKLLQMEKDLVNNFYKSQLTNDMNNHLEVNQKLSHEDFAKNLRNYLQEKYYWLTWGTHVYNPIEGYEVHAVHCENTSQSGCEFVWRKFSRNVVVSYSDLNTTEAEEAVKRFQERKDSVECEKNAEKLNDVLWAWDGIKDKKMVLVVKNDANLVSVHGSNEIEADSEASGWFKCKHFKLVFAF